MIWTERCSTRPRASSCVTVTDWNSYRDYFGLRGDDILQAVRLYRELYSAEGIYRLRMYDGVEEMLQAVGRKGNLIGLATTKPHVMADKILAFSGLKQYFDVICGSNLDGSMSDKFQLITTCMMKCEFSERSRVYMIGDRFYDIEGAKTAGVHSIGVTYGFASGEELTEAGAEFIADSPAEVARLITGEQIKI